jgi:SWIM zinc finger
LTKVKNVLYINDSITERGSSREEVSMVKQSHVGTPERRGPDRWFVPSGVVGYFVERIEGRWRCTCPSFRWRKADTCKHIQRVATQAARMAR